MRPTRTIPPLSALVFATAAITGVLALACVPELAARVDPARATTPQALAALAHARVALAGTAVVLAVLGAITLGARGICARRWVQRAVLVGLFLAVPVIVLENVLAPFVVPPTTIFQRDAELGWRLRPGATDWWAGQRVQVNERGLRGPVRPYDKPRGTARVLVLGDSVAFGFGVADDALTLPAQLEGKLAQREQQLTRAAARPVECIGTGVDGWSTWQEHAFLRREGLRYRPDVVVLAFVLNDVTARFALQLFGGPREPLQLAHTRDPEAWSWLDESSIAGFARRVRGRLAFGADARRGAKESELLDVFAALHEPGRADVQDAWASTLQDLDALVRTCRDQNVPLVLVLFPYATQLYRPELTAPRDVLAPYTAARGVPFIDLQPVFLAAVASGRSIEELFLDPVHPTAAGHEVAADEIARVILARELLGAR